MADKGIVTASALNVRGEPSTKGKMLGKFSRDEEIDVLAREDGWLKVRYEDGEGYVSADYVTLNDVKRGTVTASKLNVRDKASTDGKVVGSVARDEEVEVLASLDGWLRVRHGDGEGFVSADYVEMSAETRTGQVTASSLNLRDAPNGQKVGSLTEGTEVTILEERDGWLEVDADGETGWVSEDYVSEGEAEAAPEEPAAPAAPAGFRVDGRDVFGPDGDRFARTFRLGVFSSGTTSIEDFVEANPDSGLSASRLNVMKAVSRNEGNLDAINTWDNAFLTFGCFQWTVGTANGAGELAAVLDRLRTEDADAFQQLFGQYGLGLEGVSAPESEPPRGYFSLEGETLRTPAQKGRLRTIEWAYRFKQAGQNDVMQRVEIAHAAGRVDLFYKSDRNKVRDRHVADYVTSEYGVALLLDQHVNRPGHVPRTLAQAVDAYVEDLGADDPDSWGDAEEAALLAKYVDLRNGTSMTDAQARADRTRKAVESGMASDARGSYSG